jgi:hypothetical protein
MTCIDRNSLMMWVDGELSAQEAGKISEHINNCAKCSAFIETQKRMESLWREEWTDPSESAFEIMRSRLSPELPWWQKQRTWFIAAAVCAVYLGVRVFFTGNAGTPLSEIAIQEELQPVVAASDVPLETEIEEQMEQSVIVQAEDTDFTDNQSVTDDSPAGDELIISAQEEENLGEVSGNSAFSDWQAVDLTMAAEDYAESSETMETDRERAASVQDQTDCLAGTVQQSAGAGAESASGGGTGSGAGGLSGVEYSCYRDTAGVLGQDSSPAPSGEAMASGCAYSSSSISSGYTISITMESTEIAVLERSDWIALFALTDKLQAENFYSSGDDVVLSVGITGAVTGPEEINGAVIDIPETIYGNSTITVHFY